MWIFVHILSSKDEGLSVKKTTLKDRLEDYFALQKELPLVEDDILKERNKTELAGSYQYCDDVGRKRERALSISSGSLKDLNSLLDRKNEIQTELDFLENLVFNIPQSEMRQILTIAYFNGGREKRWERVADHFEREITGESYRKKSDRYIENLEKTSAMSVMS